MFAKQKQLKDIDNQMTALMEGMTSVPLDSEEYRKLQAQYSQFAELRDSLTKSDKGFNRVTKVLEIGVSAVGVFVTPLMLGLMSTENDKQMKIVNGRVANLIGKVFRA